MRLTAALTAYLLDKHDLAPGTHVWYEQKLTAWVAWVETHTCVRHPTAARQLEEVDTGHVHEYFTYLKTRPSTALNHTGRPITVQTLHGYARAIKALLRWGVGEGLVAERVPARITMPRRDQHVIAVFTPQDITKLLAACARPRVSMGGQVDRYPWLAERDRTIIMLLLDTGIRASELCTLTLANTHVDRADPYILVEGKGRKQREVGLGVRARQQLHRWMYRSRPDCDTPTVFVGRDRQPLDRKGLDALLRRLKEASGVTGVRCSAHDFRHTFAFTFLANGGDVMRLSRLLGHTSLAVTSGYLAAFQSRDARRGAVSVLDSMDTPTKR